MKFVAGTSNDKLSLAFCEALGIKPYLVRRIIVDMQAGRAAMVHFETFADTEVLDVIVDGGITLVTSENDA